MVRIIKQIRQDLTNLEETAGKIATELQESYIKYLNKLSQATYKQMVLASYQICTQSYPESFLEISFHQRQKLQQNLRKIGKTTQSQLLESLYSSKSSELIIPAELKENFNQELTEDTQIELSEPIVSPQTPISITNPHELLNWQRKIEQTINEILETLSKETNRYLQKAGILPNKLAAKILEIAMEAGEMDSLTSSPPNLLNLIIETENDLESEEENITNITAIRLRLSEIELSEPSLMNERHQIRHIVARINQIKQKYEKIQHELAIAEAESAWRASWFED